MNSLLKRRGDASNLIQRIDFKLRCLLLRIEFYAGKCPNQHLPFAIPIKMTLPLALNSKEKICPICIQKTSDRQMSFTHLPRQMSVRKCLKCAANTSRQMSGQGMA